MRELYMEAQRSALHRQKSRRIQILTAVCVLLLSAAITAMILRIEWLAMVFVALTAGLAVFCGDLLISPLIRYERLMTAALQERTHEALLIFDHAEPEESMIEGIPCQSLVFLGNPDKHGVREQMFYWDRNLPLPDFVPGESVLLKYTGKNIIGYALPAGK